MSPGDIGDRNASRPLSDESGSEGGKLSPGPAGPACFRSLAPLTCRHGLLGGGGPGDFVLAGTARDGVALIEHGHRQFDNFKKFLGLPRGEGHYSSPASI